MNKFTKSLILIVAGSGVLIGSLTMPSAGGPHAASQPAARDGAQTSDGDPAINEPDRFAWTVFVEINKAANNGSKDRVWEKWAPDEDVYGNPNRAPIWPGAATGLQETGPRPKTLRPITQLQIASEENQRLPRRRRQRGRPAGLFLPAQAGGEEVRMNRATFDFIVSNNLWYVEGQEAAFARGTKINFPVEAKEIKAIWRPITDAEKPRFYWQLNPADNKVYGLVAIHIITKDIPNWTWATFEQMDNPNHCKEMKCKDDFGLKPDGSVSAGLLKMMQDAGLGPEWQYYRLNGAQVDFTDSTGRPTLLGNSIIEDGFVTTSSCITCHARATIGQRIPGQSRANRLSVFKSTSPLISDNGTPDPRWYYADPSRPQTLKYLQLDFLWSMFRAKRRS